MSLNEDTVGLDPSSIAETLRFFSGLGLLTEAEIEEVQAMLAPDFPLAGAIRSAESIHVHVKVPDTERLAHDQIVAAGSHPESCTKGFVKYPFATEVNPNLLLRSHLRGRHAHRRARATPAVMDHKGID